MSLGEDPVSEQAVHGGHVFRTGLVEKTCDFVTICD